mgnify:FL=1
MAINLAEKYEKKIAEGFAQESVVAAACNNDYNWDGVRAINVYSPEYQDLQDYKRTGSNRYGEPKELQDTVNRMEITRDRSFSMTIDKGNNKEQMETKEAGRILRGEMRYKAIPEMEKYALGRFIDYAGKIDALTAAPTTDTIVEKLSDGMVHMSNKNVPNDRTIFIGWTYFGMLRLSKQFIGIDALGAKALTKGSLGTFMGAQVVPLPDEYLKKGNSQCYFLITSKTAPVFPKKINDMKVYKDVQGYNGAVIEGRFLYDAFIIGKKVDGVYAAVAASTKQANPTFAFSSGVLTITSASASTIRYTLDGSDPRFSLSAKETTSGGTVTLPSGKTTAKAVAFSGTLFTSEVVTDSERTVS